MISLLGDPQGQKGPGGAVHGGTQRETRTERKQREVKKEEGRGSVPVGFFFRSVNSARARGAVQG